MAGPSAIRASPRLWPRVRPHRPASCGSRQKARCSARRSPRQPQLLERLEQERRGIAPAPDFLARAPFPETRTQKIAQRPELSGRTTAIAQLQVEMVDISPEPPAPHTHAIMRNRRNAAAERAVHEQSWEIDSGIDRELERSPQSSVDLHEDVPARLVVALAFDHRHALPIERREEAAPRCRKVRIQRDAFPI